MFLRHREHAHAPLLADLLRKRCHDEPQETQVPERDLRLLQLRLKPAGVEFRNRRQALHSEGLPNVGS